MLIRKRDEREKAEWDERVRCIYSIVFIPEYHSSTYWSPLCCYTVIPVESHCEWSTGTKNERTY
jgi:hypothetical protein